MHTWLCCHRHGYRDLLSTCISAEEWGWGPSERWKVRPWHIKSFHNLFFVPLGIVIWILLSLRHLSALYSLGSSSHMTSAVSGWRTSAVACPSSLSRCKSSWQQESMSLFQAGISMDMESGGERVSVWVIQMGLGGHVERKSRLLDLPPIRFRLVWERWCQVPGMTRWMITGMVGTFIRLLASISLIPLSCLII